MSYTEDELDRDVKRLLELQAKISDLDIEVAEIKTRIRSNVPVGTTTAPCGVAVSVSPQRRFSPEKAVEELPDELLVLCYETSISASKAKSVLPPAVYETLMTNSGVAKVVVR